MDPRRLAEQILAEWDDGGCPECAQRICDHGIGYLVVAIADAIADAVAEAVKRRDNTWNELDAAQRRGEGEE